LRLRGSKTQGGELEENDHEGELDTEVQRLDDQLLDEVDVNSYQPSEKETQKQWMISTMIPNVSQLVGEMLGSFAMITTKAN